MACALLDTLRRMDETQPWLSLCSAEIDLPLY